MFALFQVQRILAIQKSIFIVIKNQSSMFADNEEELKRQKKEWESLFDSDRFRFIIRIPREYRNIKWNVVRTLGDGKLLIFIYLFFVFLIFVKFLIFTDDANGIL